MGEFYFSAVQAAPVSSTPSVSSANAALAQQKPSSTEQIDCSKWVAKKGYSLDWVEKRTGKRQPGFGRT
jgi:hypothetical protein